MICVKLYDYSAACIHAGWQLIVSSLLTTCSPSHFQCSHMWYRIHWTYLKTMWKPCVRICMYIYICGPVSRVPTPPCDGAGMMPLWWCIYIYTYIHTYLPTYLHTYIPTYLRTYVPTYTRTYIHTYIHACMHTHIHTCIHTYTHTDIHTHTYIHTYLPTYIPTYLHTYIPTYLRTYLPTYLPTYIHTCIHTYQQTNIPTYQHTTTTGHREGDQKNHTTTTGHGGGDQKNQTILSTHTHLWGGKGGGQRCTIYIYILQYITSLHVTLERFFDPCKWIFELVELAWGPNRDSAHSADSHKNSMYIIYNYITLPHGYPWNSLMVIQSHADGQDTPNLAAVCNDAGKRKRFRSSIFLSPSEFFWIPFSTRIRSSCSHDGLAKLSHSY